MEALRGDLAPCGYMEEPSASDDPYAIMLGISFISDALQGARYWPIGSCARR